MARKMMTRAVTYTHIYHVLVEILEDETLIKHPQSRLEIMGTVNEKQLKKIISKIENERAPFKVMVTAIETVEKRYELSVDDFIKYAAEVHEPLIDDLDGYEDITDIEEGITDDMYEPTQEVVDLC